jgi:uncharacterized protein YgbK (DUF1537 family)
VLDPSALGTGEPGLVVVGSHVQTTTVQVAALIEGTSEKVIGVHEVPVTRLLRGVGERDHAVDEAVTAANAALSSGRSAVVSTDRVRRDVGSSGGRVISAALVDIVRRIERRPAWVITKGGITSSDVATHGLGMREARVAGQILPGVPVWIGLHGSRWPTMPLVVFPGNVGGPSALLDAFRLLSAPRD